MLINTNIRTIGYMFLTYRSFLGGEQVETSLESNALARELIIRGEASRVSRFGDFTGLSLLGKRVYTLTFAVQGVHQMHGGEKNLSQQP